MKGDPILSSRRCPAARARSVAGWIIAIALIAAAPAGAQNCDTAIPLTVPGGDVAAGTAWFAVTVDAPTVLRVTANALEDPDCGHDQPHVALWSGCAGSTPTGYITDDWPGGGGIETACVDPGTYYLKVENSFVCTDYTWTCCDPDESPQWSPRSFVFDTMTMACGAEIEITPGGFPNTVNPRSRGLIPVAILGSSSFDVTDVDVTSIRFGPGGASCAHDLTDAFERNQHLQDFNLDGVQDLITHFQTRETGITCGDDSADLWGNRHLDGAFLGTDSVEPVGCRSRMPILRPDRNEREARTGGPSIPVPRDSPE